MKYPDSSWFGFFQEDEFEDAVELWRNDGGCIAYSEEANCYFVGCEYSMKSFDCFRSCDLYELAVQALKHGGLTPKEIYRELTDWQDEE